MRRLTARALLIVLTAVLMTAWSQTSTAYACSCVGRSVSENFTSADAIFVGRLDSRTVLPNISSGDAANLCTGTAFATGKLVAEVKALGGKAETPRAGATPAAPTKLLPGDAGVDSPWNRSGLVVAGALALLVGWTLRRGLRAQRRARRPGSD